MKLRIRTGHLIIGAIATLIGTIVALGPQLAGPDVSFTPGVTQQR